MAGEKAHREQRIAHQAWGYVDLPPMVAAIAQLSEGLDGGDEVASRK
jgi:hypothetical protein